MDFAGIARTIDHAVYMLLNSLAIILWRIDAALLGISMLSYNTQDWLTGSGGGGIWLVLERLIGGGGFLGLNTWQLFLGLALALYGIALVLRPLFAFRAVDLGRLLFFATLAYVFISQGTGMLRSLETWRGDAGSAMYSSMVAGGAISLPVPGGGGGGDEPIYPPHDLDGQSPLRGWEAVSTSYFLATGVQDLHAGVPPADFRRAYCLYDPAIPIDEQEDESATGCSPRLAWDEWDLVSTQAITEVWGIPLPDLSIDLPIYQEHPQNRQLGIRQAQAGVARLALGPIVALFPIVEANVGLMLALAASFIYLSMPVALLFSFFLYTESIVIRLLMQYLTIFIRTLVLNGLVALFLLILIGAAANGSLTVYLGLVGVGLVGGWFLTRMAAATMNESLSQALGAVGGIWMGATTGALGEGARRPAEMALGAAKVAAGGAALAVTAASSPRGVWTAWDVADPATATASSGLTDLRGRDESFRRYSNPGQTPDLISRLVAPNGQGSGGAGERGSERAGERGSKGAGESLSSTSPLLPHTPAPLLNDWVAQAYQAQGQGYGQQQVEDQGIELLGETLARRSQEAMARHSQAETMAVLEAAQQVTQAEGADKFFDPHGRLKTEAVQAVRERLGQTAPSFTGSQGVRDLAALTAAGMQSQKRVEPEAFRQTAAEAKPGQGDRAPGRTVPRALGLDPAAAGSHFAALNNFARVSEQAGLTAEQRQQLLTETQAGEVSPGLRQQIEGVLRQRQHSGQVVGLKVDDVIAGAQAMPETLQGPRAVKLPGATPPAAKGGAIAASTPAVVAAPPAASGETAPGVVKAPAGVKTPAGPPAKSAALPLKEEPGAAKAAPASAPPTAPGKEAALVGAGRVMASPPAKEKKPAASGAGLTGPASAKESREQAAGHQSVVDEGQGSGKRPSPDRQPEGGAK